MFANLHELPPGRSLFTLLLTDAPLGTPADQLVTEELDLVAPSRSSVADLVAAAGGALADYAEDVRVIGIADQTSGCIVTEDPTGDLR